MDINGHKVYRRWLPEDRRYEPPVPPIRVAIWRDRLGAVLAVDDEYADDMVWHVVDRRGYVCNNFATLGELSRYLREQGCSEEVA